MLEVKSRKDIKAVDLFQFGSASFELVNEFAEEEELELDTSDINVKVDVQSPGFIQLAGQSMAAIIMIGVIVVAIAGGGLTWKSKGKEAFGIKTEGLIEKIRKLLESNSNRARKREIIEKAIKDLEIKDPDDLVKILKQLDK